MDAHPPDSTLAFRISALEQDVADLKQQLHQYVPMRENELQLKSIQGTVDRIERDIQEAKKQLAEMNSKLAAQEIDVQARDAAQRASQAALQIRILWGVVSVIMTVLTGVLVGYVTHLFH